MGLFEEVKERNQVKIYQERSENLGRVILKSAFKQASKKCVKFRREFQIFRENFSDFFLQLTQIALAYV